MRIEAFTRYNEMTGDAYVMDYTQATAGKRKVCIKEEERRTARGRKSSRDGNV